LKLKNQQLLSSQVDCFFLWNSGVTLLISNPNVSSEEHFTIVLLLITITLHFKTSLTIHEMWCQFRLPCQVDHMICMFFLQLANCWLAASEKHKSWPYVRKHKNKYYDIMSMQLSDHTDIYSRDHNTPQLLWSDAGVHVLYLWDGCYKSFILTFCSVVQYSCLG